MKKFMFATGIENSYPTILLPNGNTHRVDELEKAGHYQHWRRDLELVKESGIEFLRYGAPLYTTLEGPGKYNWSFTDEVFNYMKELGITPIVDLCHFGVPDWLGNFQNTEFPYYFAEYAKAFAKRFPDLKLYTPINEMFITAMFSAQYGWWNERLSSEKSFVTALKNLCKANLMAMQEIQKVQPDVTFIQSESCEYFHAEDITCYAKADLLNKKRFLALDFTLGKKMDGSMVNYLFQNGMTKQEYVWFLNNSCKSNFILGTDYYWTNEHTVHANGTTSASGDLFGYYAIARDYYQRYQVPLMHTETNMKGPGSVNWLFKQWTNLYKLVCEGIPVLGFTWYSLIDQVDWDTALRENNGNVNDLGMYDMNRNIRPLGESYQKLIHQWGAIMNEHITQLMTKEEKKKKKIIRPNMYVEYSSFAKKSA